MRICVSMIRGRILTACEIYPFFYPVWNKIPLVNALISNSSNEGKEVTEMCCAFYFLYKHGSPPQSVM